MRPKHYATAAEKTYTNNFYAKNYNVFHELTGRHALGIIAASFEILFHVPRSKITPKFHPEVLIYSKTSPNGPEYYPNWLLNSIRKYHNFSSEALTLHLIVRMRASEHVKVGFVEVNDVIRG